MKAPLLFGVVSTVLTGLATVGFVGRPGQGAPSGEKAMLDGQALYIMPPVVHRNLALYPIRLLAKGGSENYLTLDEGLKSGLVEVREVGTNPPPLIRPRPPQERIPAHARQEQNAQFQQGVGQRQSGGEVNRLLIINRSERKLILIAGEMVLGGKQDRIVQKDSIVPPSDKPKVIDVFCVEHGRWSGSTASFSAAALPPTSGAGGGGLGGGIADPSVRGAAQAKTEQQAVWDEVGKKNSALKAAPGQSTYQAARASATNIAEQKPYLQYLDDKVIGKDIVGVVVAINGKLVWMDAFSSAPLFSKYWPKLLQSYILEAISTRPPRDMEDRIRWKLPTTKEAAAYLEDRSGTAKFEGEEDVYKLLRIDGRTHVIYELSDIDRKMPLRVHTCKMEKK